MAHFFKYQNRVMHAGINKERDNRSERLRQAGLKAGNTQSVPSNQQSNDAKAKRLADLAQQKMFRDVNKKNAIKKILNKNK